MADTNIILHAHPEFVFETAPGCDQIFMDFLLTTRKVNLVNVSLAALPDSNNAEKIRQLQRNLSVSSICRSLDEGSCDILDVIQRHSSLLFNDQGLVFAFIQTALLYSISQGNAAATEFILDNHPTLLNRPLPDYDELLSQDDRDLLDSITFTDDDDEQANNPLLVATARDQLAICKILLKRGANVHFRNEGGVQAIHFACTVSEDKEDNVQCLEILKLLVAHGADVNSLSNDAKHPLGCAVDSPIEEGDKMIRFLLNQGANLFQDDIYKRYYGSSTMMVEYGCPVERLFASLCNMSLFEEFEQNPSLLLSAREDQFRESPLFTFRMLCRNGYDWQPSNDSHQHGKLLFKHLITRCFSKLAADKKEKQKGKEDSLQHSTEESDNDSDIESGSTTMELSLPLLQVNYLDIIYSLIEGHFNADHQDGALLMKIAFEAYKKELDEALFGILARASVYDFETKVEITDEQNRNHKWNLLQCFIEYHNSITITAIVYLLEQQEIDVDVAFTKLSKQTALMRVCEQEIDDYSLPIAECLIEHGAKVNLCDKDGKTPLHHLVENKSCQEEDGGEPFFVLLLQAGADINQPDKRKQSPLTLSKAKGNKFAERLFRYHPKKRKRDEESTI